MPNSIEGIVKIWTAAQVEWAKEKEALNAQIAWLKRLVSGAKAIRGYFIQKYPNTVRQDMCRVKIVQKNSVSAVMLGQREP